MSGSDGSYVLVGVDGSAAGERALRWAADEARLRRMPLTVCHAWHWPYPVPPSRPAALEPVRRIGRHILEKALITAREAAPQIQIRGRLVAGEPPAVLVNLSKDAALALIGARRGGPDPSASPSTVRLPAYAHCPVIVVRDTVGRDGPVVVGVDDSAGSEAALAFGFEEAALRGRPLLAVHGSWEPVAIASAEMGMLSDPGQLRATASVRLERTVSPWRVKYPYVDARIMLVMRTPRHALSEAAAAAELLVLGGRGLGGVAGLRLGAVSSDMLRYAPCSVAIVRPST